jgi:hypothetical protein
LHSRVVVQPVLYLNHASVRQALLLLTRHSPANPTFAPAATPLQHRRDTAATPPQHRRNTAATPLQHRRNTAATPPQHRRNTSPRPTHPAKLQCPLFVPRAPCGLLLPFS